MNFTIERGMAMRVENYYSVFYAELFCCLAFLLP